MKEREKRQQASAVQTISQNYPRSIVPYGYVRSRNTFERCLSSIILSPLNGNVKMSPYEQGDICIEPERATTSGGDFQMREGGVGVCQGRRTPVSERAPNQTLEEAFARRRGGGSGTRQPRAAQPPPPASGRACAHRAASARHLRRLQRPPSLRKAGGMRGYFAQPRNTSTTAAPARPRLA